jgi:hypothetical protein
LGQFSEGFPRLKDLKSGPALKYLEYLNTLPKVDRRRFVLAKLKKSHLEASVLVGEPLSSAETSLLEDFYRGYEVSIPSVPTTAYISSRVEMALIDLRVSNPSAFDIDKSELLSKIEARLRPFLGQPLRQQGRSQGIQFAARIGDWSLTTTVETPRVFQLRYSHSIGRRGKAFLIKRTSSFHWMGVKMETYWNFLTEPDLDSTAESLTDMCRVFLDAATKLLPGTNPGK